jgi:flagellar biosynthesis protein FliP
MEALFGNLDPSLQLILLLLGLTLLPFIFVSMTSFMRYAIVLSILKTALGTQQAPPGPVLIGIALVMTFYTMSPTMADMMEKIEKPIQQKQSVMVVMTEGIKPLRDFMLRQTRQEDQQFFLELTREEPPSGPDDITLWEAAPAFMISELRTSFEIGFLIFIPFIVVDLVVANILLALGMMMLSPTIISLPFKILIFIAVDGWNLVIQGLVKSFN